MWRSPPGWADSVREATDYEEADWNFGGGSGILKLGEEGSPTAGSATAATSGMSEPSSTRSVGESVAVQVPSHGIPIAAHGPNTVTRGLTTRHRATTRIVGPTPRAQCIRRDSNTHPPDVYRPDHLSAVPALKTRRRAARQRQLGCTSNAHDAAPHARDFGSRSTMYLQGACLATLPEATTTSVACDVTLLSCRTIPLFLPAALPRSRR